jgi:hypothetical protein
MDSLFKITFFQEQAIREFQYLLFTIYWNINRNTLQRITLFVNRVTWLLFQLTSNEARKNLGDFQRVCMYLMFLSPLLHVPYHCGSMWSFWLVANLCGFFIIRCWKSSYQKGRVGFLPSNRFNPTTFLTCPKPRHGFPMSYVVVSLFCE